jgi:hypothetical protein
MKQDPLTYRFPRTLEEAFPDPVERGYAVHAYKLRHVALAKWLIRAGVFVILFLTIMELMT